MSLIEAMIVVAIVGILVVGAVPGIATYLASQRVSSAANDLLHAMTLARTEALKRGRRVFIAPIDGRWHDGWAVFVDRNDNRVFDADVDETIVRHDALSPSVVVTNPANPTREPFTDVGSPQRTYVMFEGSGAARQRNGGFLAGSLAISATGGGRTVARTLCVGSFGRVRIVDRPSCT